MIEAVRKRLGEIAVGEGQVFGRGVMFPLVGESGPALFYLTLAEALDSRLLTVTEVSQGGSVPELKVSNVGDQPILLLDGEEVAGAKQNRVLNASILVPAREDLVIPVSCTEQGRWHYNTEAFFDSGIVMDRGSRARKSRSVSCSLRQSAGYQSNQGEVWDSIAELQAASGVNSPTLAMRDVYEARKEQIEQAVATFALVPGQTGLVATIGGVVAGLDVLSQPGAYARLHAKLVKSYAMDAVLAKSRGRKPSIPASREKVHEFIAGLPQCEEKEFKSVGMGNDYRYRNGQVVGSALVHGGCVVHTAFFTLEEGEDSGRMSDLRHRRQHRVY